MVKKAAVTGKRGLLEDLVLNERAQLVLNSIIENYIQSSEPIGSRTLSKSIGVTLSPATIRNIMSDLAELGFLIQTHTSAGRVPTDKAYRFYVNSLSTPSSVPEQINKKLLWFPLNRECRWKEFWQRQFTCWQISPNLPV